MSDPETETEAPALNRRERRSLELARRILEAGEALFEGKGYDETTVAEICERADVAYGTFFNHFPTKVDLLSALADHAVAEISDQLDDLAKRPGNIEDALIVLFETAAQKLQTVSPGQRALAARVQSLAFTDAPDDRDRSFRAAFEAFLRKASEESRVRDDVPPETLADVLSSAYASMFLSWVHIDGFPVRRRAAAMARFLATVLSPQPTRRGRAAPST